MNEVVLTPTQRFTLIGAILVAAFVVTKNSWVRGFAIGFSLTYIVKYGVVGLKQWDTWFHPERIQADSTGPYKAFAQPLLQGVWSNK